MFSVAFAASLAHDLRPLMSTLPFWIAFVVTVVVMVAALVTGLTRRRKLHLWLGPVTMVSLAVTIVLTEELMSRYRFPADALRFHLWFAKGAALLALPVIATGVWLWRSPRARVWHRLAVWLWIASVLVATGTGLWMFDQGTLREG